MEIKDLLVRLITADRTEDGSLILDQEFTEEMIECLKEHTNQPVIKVYSNLNA